MSLLVVTTPADSLALLTAAEMREAAGLAVGDSSQDAKLSAIGLRAAASIMTACNIAVGTGGRPTLKRETLTETFRSVGVSELILSRRHEVVIDSVVEDGVTLSAADYEVNPESGMVMRLCSDSPTRWCARKVVVVYAAGFTEVPDDLKQSALETFRGFFIEAGRDPYVKATTIETVDVEVVRTELWSGSLPGAADSGAVPASALGGLGPYMNPAIG